MTPLSGPGHSEEEDRFLLVGTRMNARILIVCDCIRVNDTIRIISARNVDKRERQAYVRFRNA
ncbi:MAG: BrnT family toxin [Pseudomonadota bacterium]